MFANYLFDMIFTRRIFTTILTTICLVIIYYSSSAQTDHSIGNWNSIILKGKISPRLSLMGEGHIRTSNYDFKYDYYEVKTGIFYSFTKNLIGLFGIGIYNTDQPGGFFQTPARQKELRTWLELTMKQTYKRFYFEHRVRLEQRFIPENYKNRLKYRLGLIVPVNKAEMIQGSLYLTVADELFIPQYGPVVEKNRFFAGAGYKMNENATLQIGCVNDTEYHSNGHFGKNYLQLMLIYDFTKFIKKQN